MLGGDYLAFDTEVDVVTIGPLDVTRTVEEWRQILDRELDELAASDEMSPVERQSWGGSGHPFHFLDSE